MQTLTLTSRVAANIRGEIAKRDITHEEFAEKLGLTRNAVSAMLSGRHNITLSRLEVISDLLEIEPSKLLND